MEVVLDLRSLADISDIYGRLLPRRNSGVLSYLLLALTVVAVLGATSVAYAQMGDFYKPREPEQTKTISITADFEEDDNRFSEDDYDIIEFNMNLPNTSVLICHKEPCNYEIEGGEFRKNTFNTNRYVLDGTLKVGVTSVEGTEYSLFDLRADLDRMSSFERNDGSVRDSLIGGLEIRIPGSSFAMASFVIPNASATFDGDQGTLSIQGTESKE
jgi:hypothetical protein